MFRNRVPMDRYTLSPELLVYLFTYVCQSPQKGALLQNGEEQGHHPRGPTQTEGLHTKGCGLVPKGDH
jgi:hypothetical protein